MGIKSSKRAPEIKEGAINVTFSAPGPSISNSSFRREILSFKWAILKFVFRKLSLVLKH